MAKVNVYSLKGDITDEIELPEIFEETYRPDVIKRAVISIQTARIQPWGANPMAGKRTTAKSMGSGLYVSSKISGSSISSVMSPFNE